MWCQVGCPHCWANNGLTVRSFYPIAGARSTSNNMSKWQKKTVDLIDICFYLFEKNWNLSKVSKTFNIVLNWFKTWFEFWKYNSPWPWFLFPGHSSPIHRAFLSPLCEGHLPPLLGLRNFLKKNFESTIVVNVGAFFFMYGLTLCVFLC